VLYRVARECLVRMLIYITTTKAPKFRARGRTYMGFSQQIAQLWLVSRCWDPKKFSTCVRERVHVHASCSIQFRLIQYCSYYTLNHSVTVIWLLVATTHPSFVKHLKVTATAVRLKRPTCASKNSLSTLSAQSLGGQATLKEACSHDVARNLLRPLDWTRS